MTSLEKTILGKMFRPLITMIKRRRCKHKNDERLVRICLTHDYTEYWCRDCDSIIKIENNGNQS